MSTVKRHRTEEAPASQHDDDGDNNESNGPSLADSIGISAKTLELVANTFATTNKAAFDAMQASSRRVIEHPLTAAMEDLATMTKVAVTATGHMITSSERCRTATNDVEHLRAEIALRDETLRTQLSTVTHALSRTAAHNGTIVAAALPALAKNTSMWQRQCERLTTALTSVREASAVEESKLREQVRALEKQVADGRLRAARLQASLNCASNAAAGHQQEVVGLVQVMEQVVKRTRENAGCIVDLARSRAQVRKLQKYMTLKDIAAAMVLPDDEGQQTTATLEPVSIEAAAALHVDEGLPPAPMVRPSMPGAAVKAVAPSFYALRVLQHKDISIAELVDDWLLQGEKIISLEGNLTHCTTALEKLQREATKTHSLYSEERRRREAEERRVAELQRQRLVGAGSGNAAMAEFDKIRLQVSTLMDTNAIITVQLRHAREDSLSAERDAETFRAAIRDLKSAGQEDAVVQAVSAMKLHFEREASRLCKEHVRVATALEEANQKIEASQSRIQVERAAREQQQTAFEATSLALQESEKLLSRVLTASNANSKRAAQKDASSAMELLAHSEEHKAAAGDSHSQKCRGTTSSVSSSEVYAQLEDVANTLRALYAETRINSNHKHGVATTQSAAAPPDIYVQEELRRALHAALTFTTVLMEGDIESRKYMVNAHIADAQAICTLHEELKRTQNQLEKATLDLEKSQEFIERHGLRAVEAVLMHELEQPDPSSPTTASSPSRGKRGDGGGALLAQEELHTLRAQLQEQTITAARLKKELEAREQALETLSHNFRKSKAIELAASKRADLWKSALDSERGALRSLGSILRSVTIAKAKHSVSGTAGDEEGRKEVAIGIEDVDGRAPALSNLVTSKHNNNQSQQTGANENEEDGDNNTSAALEKEHIDIDDDEDDVATEAVEGVAEDEDVDDVGEHQSTAAVRGDDDDVEIFSVTPVVTDVVSTEGADEEEGDNAVAMRYEDIDDDPLALVELSDLPSGPLTADALAPLIEVLTTVTQTLGSIKTGLDVLVNPTKPSSSSAALASLTAEGADGNSSSAATSLKEIVEERIVNEGIASVGTLVQEIYETSGVIRRQRAALAGADAAQQSETHQLMIDALKRKCSALEEARLAQEAASAAALSELQLGKDKVEAELQNALRSRDQLLLERDRAQSALAANAVNAAKDHALQQQLMDAGKRYEGIVAEFEAFKKQSTEQNGKLLHFVKVLQGRLESSSNTTPQAQQQPGGGAPNSQPQPPVAADAVGNPPQPNPSS
ncbi:Hypothetical protein, putative [Bodo saltans]|uniref:Uncharacterized protein n=2 Tax=Bodo saltans TaxID=75058 RepID=A0A0S4JGJ3_BODSA|nr:Hypothetical protein, putative [Bodo saltans]|eukprot:CUG89646.1 Hypothetical protein, putative [Bodo saltans]